MFARLVVLFVTVPLVELYILHHVAINIGFLPTVGLVLLTGVLGAALARWQGINTLVKIQRELAAGRLPAQALLDGAMILVAAALLLTPGIVTDLFGFSLLLPPCRYFYRQLLMKKIRWAMEVHTQRPSDGESHDPSVVDGQAHPTPDEKLEQNDG